MTAVTHPFLDNDKHHIPPFATVFELADLIEALPNAPLHCGRSIILEA